MVTVRRVPWLHHHLQDPVVVLCLLIERLTNPPTHRFRNNSTRADGSRTLGALSFLKPARVLPAVPGLLFLLQVKLLVLLSSTSLRNLDPPSLITSSRHNPYHHCSYCVVAPALLSTTIPSNQLTCQLHDSRPQRPHRYHCCVCINSTFTIAAPILLLLLKE